MVPTAEYSCDGETREQRASFLLKCIDNANPFAEEDPEDWILTCEEVTIRLFCEKIKGFKLWGKRMTGFIPCSEAKTEKEKQACQ